MDKGTQNREQMSGNGVTGGSPQENEQLLRRMFAALNEHNASKVLPYLTENCRLVSMGFNQNLQGHDGFTKYLNNWIKAFPDYKLEVTNIVVNSNKGVIEYTARATHTGTLSSPMGDIPATNKRAEVKYIDAVEFSNGRVNVIRSYFDPGSLMSQLGLGTKH